MPESPSEQPSSLKGSAILTAGRIAEAWALEEHQICLILALPRLPRTEDEIALLINDSTLVRIGYIISIYRTLHTILHSPHQANSWIHRDNSVAAFGGQSAIRLMCRGSIGDLETVRHHLEAQLA